MANRFENESLIKKIKSTVNFSAIFMALVLILFLAAVSFLSGRDCLDDKAALSRALQRDIIHCYALEGSYPPDVEYMEEKYGLTYDHTKYIISYNRFASNIMPTYRIVERGVSDGTE